MSKNLKFVLGFVLIIVYVAILYWWFGLSKPSEEEINAHIKPVKSVDVNIFSNNTTKEIKERSKKGEIPVQVADDYNNHELF